MKVRAAAAALALCAAPAAADPLRLRANALATTDAPAGLLVLEADAAPRPGLSAEAVVWMAGARAPGEAASGDVLVVAVRGRTESGRVEGKVGRFVSTLGALRPVHVDGGGARVKLPQRFDVEVAGGIPVVPGVTGRAWDWVVGSRVSRRLGDGGSVGVAYAQRRDEGRRTSEELGVDAGAELGKRLDAGARAAYDLINAGLAELALTSSYRRGAVRAEVYAIHRSAAHLLPATSLFSVIGDVPSQRAGAVVTWRAAPRLDVMADLGARRIAPEYGADLAARARLRLDDRGKSVLGGELRRSGVGDDTWTGVRGTARIALRGALTFSTELELVIPDVDRGRGAVWPWGLAALAWSRGAWSAAVALEASASPEYRQRLDVLGQLSRQWGMR